MKPKDIIGYLLAALITIVGAWVGYIQTQQSKANKNREALTKQFSELDKSVALLNQIVIQMQADKSDLNHLKNIDGKHWTILSSHKDWINELMAANGKELKSWPDLRD